MPASARALEVVDGDTLVLDSGQQVRLAGIQAPKLALGRKNFSDWAYAREAKVALESLVRGKSLRLFPADTPIDRYGRLLAQLYVDSPAAATPDPAHWVQGQMLEGGFARVYTFSDNRSCAGALLAKEAAARAARRGLWALPDYAILDADAIPQRDIGQFALVEGRVVAVADRGKRAYLNFGANYRTDFTAVIESRDLALFRAEGYDLQKLQGHRVRVRGWLELLNGPFIAVTHPEQIERLDDS